MSCLLLLFDRKSCVAHIRPIADRYAVLKYIHSLSQAAGEAVSKARAFFLRHPGQPPKEPEYITTRRFVSYPQGCRIAEAGPVAVRVAAEPTV